MPAKFLILLLFFPLLACNERKPPKKKKSVIEDVPFVDKRPILNAPAYKNIRFDFTASYYDSFRTIEIDATIYNDNSYPVYFLTYYCDNHRKNLLYDTSLRQAGMVALCNAPAPIKNEIKAHDKYELHEDLSARSQIQKLKLGFHFVPLTPDLNIDSLNNYNFDIPNKMELWEEKPINTKNAYRQSHLIKNKRRLSSDRRD